MALAAVPSVGSAALAAPVSADKGGHPPAHAGKPADKPGKPADKPGKQGKPADKPGKPAGPGKPSTPAEPGKSGSSKAATGNPPGNNGTVKIAGPGDAAGHPSNNAHPGCTFLVEWYGFDAGEDVTSTVTFSAQAPTADAVISGADPARVHVGEDPAGGGTDLDGRQEYTLSFDGEPHPQQGYHVKLTVHTPYSHGADGKSKVFWVEPCSSDAPVLPGEEELPAPGAEQPSAEDDTTVLPETDEVAAPSGTAALPEAEVLGIELFADATTTSGQVAARAAVAADAGTEVPTSVAAGQAGLGDWTRSPLPLALMALGGAAGLGAVAYRRRAAGR